MSRYRVDFIITKYVEAQDFNEAENIARSKIKAADSDAISDYTEEIRIRKE